MREILSLVVPRGVIGVVGGADTFPAITMGWDWFGWFEPPVFRPKLIRLTGSPLAFQRLRLLCREVVEHPAEDAHRVAIAQSVIDLIDAKLRRSGVVAGER